MISDFLPGGMIFEPIGIDQTARNVGHPFLRFQLVPDTPAVLPVQQMAEVITMATHEIVPIPNLPAWVMGVHNWRGEILWMVSLAHLVGLDPLYHHTTNRSIHTAIVIHQTQSMSDRQPVVQQTAEKKLGLVVNQVEDMEWLNPDLIQSPPPEAVTPELVPFLRGVWPKSNSEVLIVLDARSILAGMP